MKCALRLLLMLALASCALSPQTVKLQPELKLPQRDLGSQQTLLIAVADERSDTIIGSRGGVYAESSVLTLDEQFTHDLAYELAAALTRWNFVCRVVDINAVENDGDQSLVLQLRDLSYDSNRSLAGKAHIRVGLGVVIRRGNERYEGDYQAEGDIPHVLAPSEAANNKQINKIFNLALAQVFEDEKLLAFLQR